MSRMWRQNDHGIEADEDGSHLQHVRRGRVLLCDDAGQINPRDGEEGKGSVRMVLVGKKSLRLWWRSFSHLSGTGMGILARHDLSHLAPLNLRLTV